MSSPPNLDPPSDDPDDPSDVDVRRERRERIALYVSQRLKRETAEERGRAAEIAEKTGFSTAHIANAKNGKVRGVGDDLARALAKYWEMTHAEFEEEALRVVPPSAVRDPYPNRTIVMKAPEFTGASEAVREAFTSLRGAANGKDKSVVQWALDLNRLLEWERMGLLETAGPAGKKVT
jgi:transcriptional regulator with XRE-family HTH domain